MVKGIQLNVVDRPILWHTTHSSPISKAKESLSSTPAGERQQSNKRRVARRCPAFGQVKPAKINLSLFGRLLGALKGADHVDLVEGTIGGEVDDKRKAKGKHHGEHVA